MKTIQAHFERKINSQAVEYFIKNFKATILEDIRFALKKVKDRNEVDFLTKVQYHRSDFGAHRVIL